MRQKIAVVAVVALVVLAGCSGGGGSSTPTEGESTPTETPAGMDTPTEAPGGMDTQTAGMGTATDAPGAGDTATATDAPTPTDTATPTATDAPTPTPTATPADETPTATPAGNTGGPPGYSGGEIFNRTRFAESYLQHIGEGPVSFEMTLRNRTEDASQLLEFSIVNDTEETLITINNLEQSGTTTYFVQNGTDALRNTTSGEIRYAQGENNNIEFAAGFASIFAFFPSLYYSFMDWSLTETRTIDGDTYYVYDANSLNRTAIDDSTLSDNATLETAAGHIVMRSDGLVRNGSVTLSGTTENGVEVDVELTMSMRDGPDISVEKPDWYDESDAENSE